MSENTADDFTKHGFMLDWDEIPAALMLSDLDGTILRVNQHTAAIHDATVTAMQGRSTQELFADPMAQREIQQQLKAGTTVRSRQTLFRTLAGELVWGLLSARMMATAEGPKVLSVVHDATPLQERFEQARRDGENFRALHEALTLPVVITSVVDGTILYLNQRAAQLFQVQSEDVVGHKAPDFYDDPNDRALLLAELQQKRFVKDWKICFRRKDSSRFWCLFSTCPLEYDGQAALVSTFVDITELQEAVEQQRQANAQMSLLLHNQPVAPFWLQEKRLEQPAFVSEQVQAVTGYSVAHFREVPTLWRERLHPEDLPRREARLQHLQNSEDWYGEYRWQHANGEWRWIEESVRKVEEAASELVWVGVWRDVTGKKNVELRLRERELLFNLTQHLAHVGSWSDNLQTGEIFWSDEMYRMYGYPPGKGDPATIPSRHLLLEDEQVFRDQYEESLRTSERFSQVLRLIRKDGEESTLRISWQCLWGDNGKPQRVIGTAQDITRQLAQERRLRESQMIFQQAFENAFDGFLLLNDRMQVVRVNRALRQMLNYEEEELVGRDPAVLLDADSYSEVMKSFELLATGESDGYRVERTYRAKDGTPIPVNVGASAMRREDGRLRLVIVHVQDQRSIQEAQTQLLHSAKLAAIGELTAGITHELKNPLGAILNTAEMLTDFHEMGIEFELVRHLETITSAVDRCNSIIEHMLRYTRKDELGSETKAPILLRQVLENTLMLMGASLRHNGIEVTTLLPEDPVRIWGDANALEQVVTNFVSNARDAMRESDQRRLLLKVWQEAEETVLRIQDTGCGMSEKVQARMIESFFTTKKAGRGTGLGMSISNMILKDHNARFTCRSQVGEGTTFDIYFPPLPAEGSALGQ